MDFGGLILVIKNGIFAVNSGRIGRTTGALNE